MPVVQIYMWKGRKDKEKAEIIRDITAAFEKQGVHPEHTTVIIHDVDKADWGMGGTQASKLKAS